MLASCRQSSPSTAAGSWRAAAGITSTKDRTTSIAWSIPRSSRASPASSPRVSAAAERAGGGIVENVMVDGGDATT